MKALKRKILIVEDEESIRFLLKQNLEYEGYEVIEADSGTKGMKLAISGEPDLIILDLMLPEMSGMEVCKRLRSTGNAVPIIMLTARGEQMDKIIGLKSGADDYITKPFDILELTVRIEALLRRSGKQVDFQDEYKLGNLLINFNKNAILSGEKEIELTKQESKLLKYFIHHEGKVLEREKIMDEVWGHEYLLSHRTIDTHVTYLRKKIETDPSNPKHIITVHRVGYKFLR